VGCRELIDPTLPVTGTAPAATIGQRIKAWALRLRNDTLALYFCARHPETPLAAKLFALLIAAYALSPIDLIPDFIPVLGHLDELILLPGAVWLCLRIVPPAVLAQCRARSDAWFEARRAKPTSYAGAAIVIALWFLLLLVAWWSLVH
jgi:uncharacterized membrane protein YkvA (DUF1232 family)